MGLNRENPALDPLAVQHLDNQLSIIYIILHDLVSQVNLFDQISLIVNHFATYKINWTLLILVSLLLLSRLNKACYINVVKGQQFRFEKVFL